MGGRDQEREGLGHRLPGVCLCCGLARNPLLSAEGGGDGEVKNRSSHRQKGGMSRRRWKR